MLPALQAILRSMGNVAVAVSGGVDSLTLATVVHRCLGAGAAMHHATSPAVPAEATERTRALATAEGWDLEIFDAGEFDVAEYRTNPVNRCFFCKTSLYGAIARRTIHPVVSGTNLDDLSDYRPGLRAARDHAVRHPFVEAGIDKQAVRALAAELGLGALADLPSAPCLSSRVETGIRIEARALAMIHAVEQLVTARLAPATIRCRVRATGVVIELDPVALTALTPEHAHALGAAVSTMGEAAGVAGKVSFAPYRTGSAFLRMPA